MVNKKISLKEKLYNFVAPVIKEKNMVNLSPADVFFLQIRDDEYAHYDIILKYAYIQNYFELNDDEAVRLYKKMRSARPGKHTADEASAIFDELIKSVVDNGYNKESYTMVNRYFYLLDAAHRNAVGLYLNIPEMKVLYQDSGYPMDYRISWFTQNGFSDSEVEYIQNKYQEMYAQYNQRINIVYNCNKTDEVDKLTDILSFYGDIELKQTVKLDDSQIKHLCHITGTKPFKPSENNVVVKLKLHTVRYDLKDNGSPLPFIKYKYPVFSMKNDFLNKIKNIDQLIIPDNFIQNNNIKNLLNK